MSTAADNITLNLGSGGPVVSTDYITGEGHVQYVKLDIGGDNAHSPVTGNNGLPVVIGALPNNWTTIPVGGGSGGQGITITGSIDAGFVGLTGASFTELLAAVKSVTIGSADGVTFGVMNVGSDLIGITTDQLIVKSFAGGATLEVDGGTVGEVTLVKSSPATGITLVAGGITIGVSTLSGDTVSITVGSGGGPFPVSTSISTEAVTSLTAGMKFVNNLAASNKGEGGVTFPDFKAKKYIEFFNLPGGTTVGSFGGFKDGTRGAFANAGANLLGGIAIIGSTGATAAGITLGYLAASAGFQLLLPGERLKVPAQDLENFVAQCMTGPDGATQCGLQFTAY